MFSCFNFKSLTAKPGRSSGERDSRRKWNAENKRKLSFEFVRPKWMKRANQPVYSMAIRFWIPSVPEPFVNWIETHFQHSIHRRTIRRSVIVCASAYPIHLSSIISDNHNKNTCPCVANWINDDVNEAHTQTQMAVQHEWMWTDALKERRKKKMETKKTEEKCRINMVCAGWACFCHLFTLINTHTQAHRRTKTVTAEEHERPNKYLFCCLLCLANMTKHTCTTPTTATLSGQK